MDDDLTRGFPAGDMRASHADRDRAVSDLSAAFEAGRLDVDEFNERSSQALRARTGAELTVLFADLPLENPRVPAVSAVALGRTRDAARRRVGTAVATGGGVYFTFASLMSALTTGATTISQSAETAPNGSVIVGPQVTFQQGPDWAGTILFALCALIFFAVAIQLRRTSKARRTHRGDSPA